MKNAILTLALLAFFINIFAQDNIKPKNVLIIESTKENKWDPSPAPKFFRTGNRIYVERRYDSTHIISIVGKIQHISDSSITVNGAEFKLKDIIRINNYRRGITATAGAGVLFGGLIANRLIVNYYKIHTYEYDGTEGSAATGPELLSALIIFTGAVATIVGIIEVGSTKHYKMNGNWRFEVKPDIFQAPKPQPFPVRNKAVKN